MTATSFVVICMINSPLSEREIVSAKVDVALTTTDKGKFQIDKFAQLSFALLNKCLLNRTNFDSCDLHGVTSLE